MKKILKIISLAIPVFIALSQYLPHTSPIWSSFTTDREIIINLISLYFLLLGLTLYLEIASYHAENIATMSAVTNKVMNNTESKLISDKDFYTDFYQNIEKAQSIACICYFAPHPPSHTNHEDRKDYYKKIKKIIRSKKDVNFKRIIRETPANIVWIKELIKEFKDLPNFHLGILKDENQERMPLALSVQVIDNKHTWFVAIEGHERSTHYRDLYVEGENCATAMHGYFNRLWNKSDEIISSGVLTAKGSALQNQP